MMHLRLGLHKLAKEGLLCLLESCTKEELDQVLIHHLSTPDFSQRGLLQHVASSTAKICFFLSAGPHQAAALRRSLSTWEAENGCG